MGRHALSLVVAEGEVIQLLERNVGSLQARGVRIGPATMEGSRIGLGRNRSTIDLDRSPSENFAFGLGLNSIP
jgi:hypothetical protein